MIYICKMQGMPFVKIGYSENPEARYSFLNGASPFSVFPLAERNGSRVLEKNVHSACRKFLIKNEWYHDCDAVRKAFFETYDPFPEAKNATALHHIQKRDEMAARIAFGCSSKTKIKNAMWYMKKKATAA